LPERATHSLRSITVSAVVSPRLRASIDGVTVDLTATIPPGTGTGTGTGTGSGTGSGSGSGSVREIGDPSGSRR